MDDVTGTTVQVQGHGITATLDGATQISTSVKGKALQLNRYQYVHFVINEGNSCLRSITSCPDTLTVAMWVDYRGSAGKWASLFTNNDDMQLFYRDNAVHLYCLVPGSTGRYYDFGFTAGSGWVHIVFSCSRDNSAKLHVSGLEVSGSYSLNPSTYGDGSGNAYLGKINSGYTEPVWVDELYIIYKELDAEIIDAISTI